MGYFENLRGYDDEVAQDFYLSLIPLTRVHATIVVRGLSIDLTPKLIRIITTLPLGVPWRKEDKGDNQISKKKLFLEGEDPIEDKNGVRRASLPYPRMRWATTLSNTYHPREGIVWFMGITLGLLKS